MKKNIITFYDENQLTFRNKSIFFVGQILPRMTIGPKFELRWYSGIYYLLDAVINSDLDYSYIS